MRRFSVNHCQRGTYGMTLPEVLVCIAISALLASLLVVKLNQARHRARRIGCVSRLKVIGLGFRTFAVDAYGNYPWRASTTNGGIILPAVGTTLGPSNNVFAVFACLSNELSVPRIVRCPDDRQRKLELQRFSEGLALGSQSARYPSYFLGLDATEQDPMGILCGDRNLVIKSAGLDNATPENYNRIAIIRRDLLYPGDSSKVTWDQSIHNQCGNLLLSDGSVQPVSQSILIRSFDAAFIAKTNDFPLLYPALEN
jgi:prepilin-type N-terminal cleavage/methylation domain-containing protein